MASDRSGEPAGHPARHRHVLCRGEARIEAGSLECKRVGGVASFGDRAGGPPGARVSRLAGSLSRGVPRERHDRGLDCDLARHRDGQYLEGVVGAWLVNRFANGPTAFDRSQDVFKFAFLAVIVSTSISATLGVTSLVLGGFASLSQYGAIWLTWWLGDATGDIMVAPFLVLWGLNLRLGWTRRQGLEAAALLLSVVVLGLVVFAGLFLPLRSYPIEFVCIPLLLWPAFRFAQREAATAASLLSGIAILGTLHGSGPFVRESPNESSFCSRPSWAYWP